MDFPKDNELFRDLTGHGYTLNTGLCPRWESLKAAIDAADEREANRFYADVEERAPWLYEQEFLEWVKTHDMIGEYPDKKHTITRNEVKTLTADQYKAELSEWEKKRKSYIFWQEEHARREAKRRQEEAQRAVEEAEARARAAFDAEEEARMDAFNEKADLAERLLHNSYYTNYERMMRGEMSMRDYGTESSIRYDLAGKISRDVDDKRRAAANKARAAAREAMEEAGMYDAPDEVLSPSLERYISDQGVSYHKAGENQYIYIWTHSYNGYDPDSFNIFKVLKLAPRLDVLAGARKKQRELQQTKDTSAERHYDTISGAVYDAQHSWVVTLRFLLPACAAMILLIWFGLNQWMPLLDAPRENYYALPKVWMLAFHASVPVAVMLLMALVMVCLTGASFVAPSRSIHYPLAIIMGVLLGVGQVLFEDYTALTSIMVPAVAFLFFAKSVDEPESGQGWIDIFLVVGGAVAVHVGKNFFTGDLFRLEIIMLVLLAVIAVQAALTEKVSVASAKEARKWAETKWAESERKLEKDLAEANKNVSALEQEVSALIAGATEQEVLFEYKVIRLMDLWMRSVGRIDSSGHCSDMYTDMEAELRRAAGAPAAKH